ncbi:monovalent cation:proton antiporter-2 (CPA2) family protein [Pseudoroseomonas cervicalis]|uniref:monovalent cation:proton antiporter-2 (CPA2) family protein n=1 Tax=Teichococcus cervicalis TaxID=204525 RepID=UPI0022F1D6FC|nr:monovalent cation:proton antiporter-2 (CPA2) family protein [Pseudoroseomonas cervicalis]WBV43640.1 monovalent cation:proton antiporter-2 (CPA2) family protein [Pseudoroseomonas cervicalis]
MAEASHLAPILQPMLFLGAAVIAVPLAKRLGLGSVLGYIAGGIVIGPAGLGLFADDPARLAGIAELGVVLLLFIIGLELNLGRLWALRRDIFGLGTAQVLGCGLVLALLPWLAGESVRASLVAGLGLALSSTALVMPLLEERGELETPQGRTAFAILLLQDLAIVPLLALVAFLSPRAVEAAHPAWVSVALGVGAVAVVVLAGRYLLNPFFALLARSGAREIMTAAALLVVLGAAGVMALAGLSMAMGAFLAGLLLAESNYRHELEADIEPFRGLLLGLFFLTVGMGLDLRLVLAQAPLLLLATLLLVGLKALATHLLARGFGHKPATALRSALLLSQAGEFGFVLYATAVAAGVMRPELASLLVALVVLSMAVTPPLLRLAPLILARCGRTLREAEEDFSDARGDVLLVGFGRFGQLVSQVLLRQGCSLTLLDHDVHRIQEAARFGARVHYGDGTRLEVLRAAGAGRARLILVCTDKREATDRIVAVVREAFPGTPCLVRAYDRVHALALMRQGIEQPVRETVESALLLGREALLALGLPREEAEAVEQQVRQRDRDRLAAQALGGLRATPEPLTPPRPRRAPGGAEEVPAGAD